MPDEVASAIENLKRTLVNCNRYNYCSDAVKRIENACRARYHHVIHQLNREDKMTSKTLKVMRLDPKARIPQYHSAGAACFDLYGTNDIPLQVTGTSPLTIGTGLAFEVPEGHVMLVYSRSGDGFVRNVRLANCVGVIDADYRGEVKVKLTADAGATMTVLPATRIAQAMIVKLPDVTIEEVDSLTETERGTNGFGSTGNK